MTDLKRHIMRENTKKKPENPEPFTGINGIFIKDDY